MASVTFEGIVENGRIRLPSDVVLPDNTKVFVTVPEQQTHGQVRVASPRLVHREQAADFAKQVIEVKDDAGL
jgi:hypothetical protein